MRTLRLLSFCLLWLSALPLSAQRVSLSLFGSRQAAARPVSNKMQRKKAAVPAARPFTTRSVLPRTAARKEVPKDTALYLHLTRRYGFYYGIGRKLTKAEAAWLPCCYRLTEPDGRGRYTVVEAVRGDGSLTADNGFRTYLTDNYGNGDNGIDSLWAAMLRTVVQVETLSSDNSRLPVMEAAYNAQGDMVYAFLPTRVNDSTVMGHYTDSFGEPVVMRKGSDAGNYIQIVMDTAGYEREIRYINDDAFSARNGDGAFMQKRLYDGKGNTTRVLSCLMDGRPYSGTRGCCGYSAVYDSLGRMLSKVYLDDSLMPMRMAENGEPTAGVTVRRFAYDPHLRLAREYYTGTGGAGECTGEGIQQRLWTYDDRGNVLSETSLDSLGTPRDDYRGIALTAYTYDGRGTRRSVSFRDARGRYANDKSGVCLYDGNDRYRTTDGTDTLPVYKETVRDGMTTTADYTRNLVHETRYDTQGRQILSAFYDLDGKPVDVDGCHRQATRYYRKGGMSVTEDSLYASGDTVREVTTVDPATRLRTMRRYHGDTLTHSFTQVLDADMQTVAGQYGSDALGNPARSHLEDALYYRVNSGTTYRGETAFLAGRNEYGEPAYVQEGDEIYCMKVNSADNSPSYLDEDNMSTGIIKTAITSRNAFCVEVLTRKAYALGLRSGDIIVGYGNAIFPSAAKDDRKAVTELQTEMLLDKDKEKRLLLMRHDPKTGPHMVSLTLPEGTNGDNGFLIHQVYYTRRETQRYDDCAGRYLSANGTGRDSAANGTGRDSAASSTSPDGGNTVMLLKTDNKTRVRTGLWKTGVAMPEVVLGIANVYNDSTRAFAGIEDSGRMKDFLNSRDIARATIYYTTDGKTVGSRTIDHWWNLWNILTPTQLPGAAYRDMQALADAYFKEHDYNH